MQTTFTPTVNSDPTKATFGQQDATGSNAIATLQANLNKQNAGVSGYVPLKVDGLYGKLTQDARNLADKNGLANNTTPAITTPTVTTPTTPAPTPTTVRPVYDPKNEPKPVLEKTVDQIQAEKLAQSQAEIDNINKYYDTVYGETKVLTEKNSRSTNAISVLSGLSGSTEASDAFTQTETKNTSALNKVNQERQMAIASILSTIKTNAVAEARQSRLDSQKSEEDRLAYRAKQGEEAKGMLASLSKTGSGASLEGLKSTLDESSYKYLIDSVGGELNAKAILFENRSKDTVIGTPQLIGGKVVQAYTTPEGKIKYENIDLPNGVNPGNIKSVEKTDSGIVIINNDGTWSKVTNSGSTTGTGGGKPIKSGGVTFTGEQIGTFSKTLEASRGTDGYVDPYVYKQAYDAWIGSKALAKDFITQYPPNKYVNPTDKTLPPLLKNSTKASSSASLLPAKSNTFPPVK